jgi:hypothetical protein
MGATRQGSTWRFEETVTGGRERCPGPVVATITEIEGLTDAIEITVRGTGIAGAGTGEFYRIDDSLLEEDYAQASGAGAGARTLDPLVAELLAEPARCNPGETGTDFLHAENERWFIAGEPIYFGDGPDYVKQGLPRVISAGDLAPFEIHSGVAVYVDAGVEDEEPETVYLLVGAPPRQRAAGECQYQPYRLAQD